MYIREDGTGEDAYLDASYEDRYDGYNDFGSFDDERDFEEEAYWREFQDEPEEDDEISDAINAQSVYE